MQKEKLLALIEQKKNKGSNQYDNHSKKMGNGSQVNSSSRATMKRGAKRGK